MHGFTEIEISDKKIGIKFGLPAIRQIAEKMAKYNLITGDSYNELGIAHIIYAGYCNNCMVKDEVPSIPFSHFYDFVEQAILDKELKEKIVPVVRIFEESRFLKQALENKNGHASDEEKKRIGAK